MLENGDRCCLGFLGKACGISDPHLLFKGTPSAFPSSRWPPGILDPTHCFNSEATRDIVGINDAESFSEAEREALLVEKFKALDIEVNFV